MPWKTKETIIYNTRIYDFVTYIDNGFIHFEKEIIYVGVMDEYEAYLEAIQLKKNNQSKYSFHLIDGNNKIVLPTLIAGHTHIYSTFARGMSVEFNPTNFKDILEQLWWKMDNEIDLEITYLSGLVSGLEFVKNGVTTVFDHHASGKDILGTLELLQESICDESGMRGGFCFETSDRYPIATCIDENIRFMDKAVNLYNAFGLFGLHASMTLSDETLKSVKEYIQDKPIHIHVAESKEDVAHCMSHYGKTIIQRLDDFGLLNKGSILAHCLYINEEEAEIIARRECYVALNVTSNMNNSVGLPNIKLLKKANIKCIIGNDGMTTDIASEWRNLLFSMHYQTGTPTGFSLKDLHEMILNSYEYASKALQCKLGQLKEGFLSDLMVIDYISPTPINTGNALGHIIFGLCHSLKPKHVWCDGVQLVNDYELDNERYKNIIPKLDFVQDSVKKLWDRINQPL